METYLISKKELIISLVLSLLITAFIHSFGSQHHTFSGAEDNISNISSAYLFRKIGLEIYKKPTQDFLTSTNELHPSYPEYAKPYQFFKLEGQKKPLYLVWPNIPRPYPIGAWLWYAPSSFLVFDLDYSIREATLFTTFGSIIVAHICFFLFLNLFLVGFDFSIFTYKRGIDWIILFFCYTQFVFWSGQGQYDLIAMVPLLCMLYAYRSKNYALALFCYGVSLFFHFRGLFDLGLTLFCIYLFIKDCFENNFKNLSPKNYFYLISSIILALVAIVIFYWNTSHLIDGSIYYRNRYFISKLFNLEVAKIIYFLVVTWGIVIYFALRKNWPVTLTLLTTNLVLISTPQVQDWYTMFLFPVFLILDRKEKFFYLDSFVLFLSYVFISSTYLNESPFSFSFIKVIYQSIIS